MSTRVLPLALAALLAAGAARADPAPASADPQARYQALLSAAQAGGPDVDWGALRRAYADRPGFKVFVQNPAKRRMFEAAGAQNCAEALPAAKDVLTARFIDADAHMVAAYCEDAAGQTGAAARDRAIGAGLVKSMQTAGDGLSPATAFNVVDVDEEYSLLRALGLKLDEQALIQDGGHAYDALAAVDAAGRKATYYVLIDRVLAAESAALTPGAVSEGGPPGRSP
jgi:hypothetical protein